MEVEIRNLMEKLLTKAAVARKSVEFCSGDQKATSAVINSIYVELGDVQRQLIVIQGVVDNLRKLHQKVTFFASHLSKSGELYNGIAANLPKRLLSNSARLDVKPEQKKTQGTTGKAKDPAVVQREARLPTLSYPTLDDFANIPKYMKGRLTYDGLNGAIEEFNVALTAKYNFLKKGFPANGSMADKNKYKEMRSVETKATRGLYFVVADDLRASATLKSETNRRSIFAILRHLQLIREVRGPGPILRFAVA